MSFGIGREIYLNIGNRITLGEVTLSPGQFFVSGPKTSFQPRGKQTVFGYETDDDGNIAWYYLNGEQVSFETWQIEIAKDKDLRNSNFGEKPPCGMKSLVSREASRFLEPPTPTRAKRTFDPTGRKDG
ncbi:MAG: hypothetical protein LBF49_02955 [Puniceicoccales bacterium]|jgi:hypothetical protein|nr:hypothetical protein [Puniceicoccales bacterium]